MKILVAIPVYDGKLQVQTVTCLMSEQFIANQLGDELQVEFLPSCSVPAMGRNQLAQAFMDSDCDKLVFLDSDISFEPGSIVKLAHMPQDFVGGCYRFKLPEECYPIGWLPNDELWADKFGLLEVGSLPTGFLCLSKKVFQTLKEATPEKEYTHFGKKNHCYFEYPFEAGKGLYSEDSFFCREWKKIGGKIYLYPEFNLTHWDGNIPYKGNIGQWLKKINGIEVAA